MMSDVKNIYLTGSYVIHALCEIFLGIYVFILSKKYDVFYSLYISFILVLKFIFRYECIINYFDKKILDPSYILGSNPSYVLYKKALYFNNNQFIVFLLNFMIVLNLAIIAKRNKSKLIRNICIVNILLWLFIGYKNYLHSTKK